MKPIYDAWLIQIEITNVCRNRCAHCTRSIPHIKAPYFADLTFIETALQSLEGWKRGVGCMGGEPTLHPRFLEICSLYRKYFSKKQCGLFTSGGPEYDKNEHLIHDTFGIIHYHNHKSPGYHQPVMVASEEVISDERLRKRLIDNCWLQRTWSPAISNKGAFFCEVAAMFDLLFNGPGGYIVEKNWWNRNVSQFTDQVERYCRLCSIAIPMESYADSIPYDYVSKKNAERLKISGSPMAGNNNLKIFDEEITLEKIKEIKRKQAIKNPGHYARRDGVNFFCKSSFTSRLWSKNIKHELYRFLRTGNLVELINSLKPVNYPNFSLRIPFFKKTDSNAE